MAYARMHLIFFMFLIPLCTMAQNDGTVAMGSILTANETSTPWLSPSGDFAFGFQQLKDKDLFLLSIWYHKIPDKTVVWYRNSIDPVPRGSTIEFDAQAGLVLRDPQGRSVWTPDAGIPNQADHGVLNDTGNFILKGSDNSWLWESFRFPADTILPLQILEPGRVLNSRKSATNFSRGRFYLHFKNDGNLVLATKTLPNNTNYDVEYFNSETSNPTDPSYSDYRVIFYSSGIVAILKSNNQTQPLGSTTTLPSTSENYIRATLDFDGLFTYYYHPRTFTGNPNWTSLWSEPNNICINMQTNIGSGACGFNNICTIEDGRPVCECPKGYVLLDPNDNYGSCKPNFTLDCGDVEPGSVEDLYDFVVLNGINWPTSDYERIYPSDEAVCKQSCLQDCFCAVAIFSSSGCWKKKLPLSNGKAERNTDTKAFIKYRKGDTPPLYPRFPQVPEKKSKSKDQRIWVLVGSVLLGSSLFINILLIATACSVFYFNYQKKNVGLHTIHDAMETNMHFFSYKELVEATNGFREELGRGSFGIVYKGELQISSRNHTVAVKKLDRMAQDAEKEFRAEVNTIGQTNHKNLVRLVGFCDEGQHRLLVYDYMSGSTLARLLLQDPKPSWNLRVQVAIGVARGLVYLHEECSTQIIHCDIKPQNILLDEHFDARISDFGLAKLLMIDQSRTFTDIRGTKGYVAPEWFRNTRVNAKVDVYSFGVLLLEIISCRKTVKDIEIGYNKSSILTDWAWDCFEEGKLDTFVENDLEALNDRMTLEKFLMIGIWCIQENSCLRPTMRKVSQMLEGIVEVMVPPCPSPFSTAGGH